MPKKKTETLSKNPIVLTEDEKAAFWAQVDTAPHPKGCWLWTGSRNAEGRGQKQIRGVSDYAYRWAYYITRGHMPADLVVCHTCDTPACVCPEHLVAGTQKRNMEMMVAHGRAGTAKLKPAAVRAIKKELRAPDRPSHKRLAERYSVSRSAISKIATDKTWSVVPAEPDGAGARKTARDRPQASSSPAPDTGERPLEQ